MQIHDVKAVAEANKQILDRYPFLWPTTEEGVRIPLENFGYMFTSAEKIPHGWVEPFGQKMLSDIRNCVEKAGKLSTFLITHLGVSGGRLVIGGNEDIDGLQDIFDEYVYMSERICVECGGKADYIGKIMRMPICKRCKDLVEASRQGKIQNEFERLELPEWRKTENGKDFTYDGRHWVEIDFGNEGGSDGQTA